MNPPTEIVSYIFWSAVVVLGVFFEFVDRKWIKRPALGLLLVAGILAGYVMTRVSPFNLADGGLGLQGFLLAAASGLALISYASAWIWNFARRRFGKPADS